LGKVQQGHGRLSGVVRSHIVAGPGNRY
jgi:hypothetical protein